MKSIRTLLLIVSLICFGNLNSNAQVFPVYEDFESYTAFQTPTGFTGDVTVYLAHGTNSSKALAFYMNTFNLHDSITTPLYGPLDGGSTLLYDWRLASTTLYPTQSVSMVVGDAFEVYISTDGVNYQMITSVDNTNYFPDVSFQTASLGIGTVFPGQNINLKFVTRRGANPDEYFVDVDNLFLFDATAVASLKQNDIVFYPTIVTDHLNFNLSKPVKAMARIYDLAGRRVASEPIESQNTGSLDLTSLAPGNYILKLEGNTSISCRFEKK